MNIIRFWTLANKPFQLVTEALEKVDYNSINEQLLDYGLPRMFFNNPMVPMSMSVHSQYRIATPPRFVVNWFSVSLEEIYFEFLSNPEEEGYRSSLEMLGYDTINWVDGTYPNQVHLEFTYYPKTKKLTFKRK